MKYIVLALVIGFLAGCSLEDMNPEYREMKAKQRQEAWDGPCKEMGVKKEKLIHMTCTNKNHKLVTEGDLVMCKCFDNRKD